MPKQSEASPLPPNTISTLGVTPGVLAKRDVVKPAIWCEKPGSNLEYDRWCDPLNPKTVTYKDILKAASVIKGEIKETPVWKPRCNTNMKLKLYYKLEIFHKNGSFHERTALYCLSMLTEDQRKSGVITASMGNWAMALAYHGFKLKIPTTVVLPVHTISRHVQYCEEYGARVILYGANFADAKRQAFVILSETAATYINSYDHPHAIAAAGTIGKEILEQMPETDAILIPVGGGGLLAGIATAAKKLKPGVLIYGVEPDKCCCFFKAMENRNPYGTIEGESLAGSLAVSSAGYNSFHTAKSLVDKMVLVDDNWIARAMLHLLENDMLIAEAAGAASFGALFGVPDVLPELHDKTVVCVISGGNIDVGTIPRYIERAKAAEGRLIKLTVTIPSSRPEYRAKVLKIIGNVGCFVRDCLTEKDWQSDNLFYHDHMILICETRDISQSCTLKRVLEKIFPNVCCFLEDPFCAIPTCACFPKRVM